MERNFDIVEFVSGTTAGVVNVQLGYVPDMVMFVSDHGGTPKVMYWVNNSKYAGFPAARTVQVVGGSTAFSADANTLIAPYAGYERISADQTANSTPKHVDMDGAPAVNGRMTQAGITIAAAAQVNSGRNLVFAFRGGK